MRSLPISVALLALVASGARADDRSARHLERLDVQSPAFAAGGDIPREYTCDGLDRAPPLVWSHAPRDTRSVAILVEDLDAPQGTLTLWLVTGIAPQIHSLAVGGLLPDGALVAEDDLGKAGWFGPCPSSGTHHYAFHVYALDTALDRAMSRADFERFIDVHALASGDLVAVYRRYAHGQ
jgi:Raf kinase inhibitor-like YbhB/YbcL family protein